MALVIADRVKVTTTTTGTGDLSLAAAATGFQDFSVVGDGNTTYYTISSPLSSEWEVGIGTYGAAGPTLSRDTIFASSNSGSAVNFSAGTKDVYVVYPSERAVMVNGSTVTIPNSATVPVASGGTGASTAANALINLGLTATATELNYVDGVTSAIQTQLDAMVEKAGDTMTGFLTLHADPTSNLHAATKSYVDEVAQGVALKPAADAASTANISGTYNNGSSGVGATMTFAAAASFSVDGVTFDTVGQGLLLKDQTSALQNGRYYLSTVGDAGTAWVFTRCGYCDTSDEIPGGYIFIQGGTANASTGWVMTVADAATFTVGTDDIDVIQFSGAGTYTAGAGLDLTGTVFSHEDTSSQASVNNSGNTFIQDITVDTYGHITALASATAVINDGTLTMGVSGTGLSGSASFTANDSDNVTFTVTSNATNANTGSTIVARDASGNFSAGTISAALSGNASTATALQTARTIGGVSFDGTANINLPGVNTAGNQSTSGNAATATKLATSRTISLTGDVTGSASFDGSANASITATVADDSHNHIISNVDGLQTALDAKQPLDADLTAIAGLSSADGNFIVGSATGWVAESGATARTSLGLGSLATLSTVDASTITDNSVGAAELNVSGNGTTSQFLRSDGDGTFTWATPTDTNTTYSAGTGLTLSTTTFSVNYGTTAGTACQGNDSRLSDSRTCNNSFDNAATARTNLGLGSLATLSTVDASTITDNSVGAAELNVAGNGTTSQFLRSDGDGTFTWATPTDTNTTYSAGAGLDLTGTTFSIEPDLRDGITHVGLDTSDFIYFVNNSYISYYVNGSDRFRMESDGDFHADGDVIAYSTTVSDERLKEEIQTVEGALSMVNQMRGVTFKYKKDGKESAGVVAQELEQVFPRAVSEKKLPLKTDDDLEYKTVQYDQLHAVLIEAIKELSAKVKELEAKVG